MGPKNTTAGSSLWYKWAVGWKDFFFAIFQVLWKGKRSPMSSKFLLKVGGTSVYDESSKVVVHFPCHGCLQIIVWMCVFLLF